MLMWLEPYQGSNPYLFLLVRTYGSQPAGVDATRVNLPGSKEWNDFYSLGSQNFIYGKASISN